MTEPTPDMMPKASRGKTLRGYTRGYQPEATPASATPSRRKSVNMMAEKPKSLGHESEIEVQGAEEARERYAKAEQGLRTESLDHPEIISEVVQEMDEFFLAGKPKNEELFELNYYKLHEDLQQAIMEYTTRVDAMHDQANQKTLAPEEQRLLKDFKGQLKHLENIFAQLSDNPQEAKEAGTAAYQEYVAWRNKESAGAMAKHEAEAKKEEPKPKQRRGKTESLRIIEDTREFEDSDIYTRTENDLKDFLAAKKPTDREVQDLASKLQTALYGYDGLLARIENARQEATNNAEPKRLNYLSDLEKGYKKKHARLEKIMIKALDGSSPEALKAEIKLTPDLRPVEEAAALAEHEAERAKERVPQEALEIGEREREENLLQEQTELMRREDKIRESLAKYLGTEAELLPSRGKAIFGMVENPPTAKAVSRKNLKEKPKTSFLEKVRGWFDSLASGTKPAEKEQPKTGYSKANKDVKELIRIQARLDELHQELKSFKDYHQKMLQDMEASKQALEEERVAGKKRLKAIGRANLAKKSPEQLEKEYGIAEEVTTIKEPETVETSFDYFQKEAQPTPAFSVEWTLARYKNAGAEWDNVAPTIKESKLGPEIQEMVSEVARAAEDADDLSDDYFAVRHMVESIRGNAKYQTCPEAAMLINLEALPAPQSESDRKIKSSADKAVRNIKKLIQDAKAEEIPVTIGEEITEEKPETLKTKTLEVAKAEPEEEIPVTIGEEITEEAPTTLKSKSKPDMSEPLSEDVTKGILEELSAPPAPEAKKKPRTLKAVELPSLASLQSYFEAKARKNLEGKKDLMAQWDQEASDQINQRVARLAEREPKAYDALLKNLSSHIFKQRIDQLVKTETQSRKETALQLNTRLLIEEDLQSRLGASKGKKAKEDLTRHYEALLKKFGEEANQKASIHEGYIADEIAKMATEARETEELMEEFEPQEATETKPVIGLNHELRTGLMESVPENSREAITLALDELDAAIQEGDADKIAAKKKDLRSSINALTERSNRKLTNAKKDKIASALRDIERSVASKKAPEAKKTPTARTGRTLRPKTGTAR